MTATSTTATVDTSARTMPRWYETVDTIVFAGVLNLLLIVFTLAGGVVLGWAPALAAAAACSRDRLRGRRVLPVRAFARAWARGFLHANLLTAPAAVTLALLATSHLALQGTAPALLVVGLAVVAALCVLHVLLTLTMDAHYDLRRRDCVRLAWAFMIRFPGAPLLLAATTALAVVVTAMVPGLLPVISLGAWVYLCTALSLSFYAANDRNVTATTPE
ncbi:DUF624 domain-containing protein [Isoptericola jiangsuensis]|uniref:DUF624 domain-containing protein n=1 Tax=Isoptericola jiangsuensis TaxID=548579 RepID=UPI003AAB8FC2